MNVKKILALLLAAMMVFGMTSAMAADPTDGTFVIGNPDADGAAYNDNTNGTASVTFQVKLTPETELTVPATSFTYTIGNGTQHINADGSTPSIYAGIAGGAKITNGTASFSVGTTKGEAATQLIKVEFDNSKFNNVNPGIYRYTITQAKLTTEQVDAGITRESNYATALTKYLDVYVAKVDATSAARKVVAAVLQNGDNNPLSWKTGESGVVDYTGNKCEGFENFFGQKVKDDPNVDDPDDPVGPNPPDTGKRVVTVTKKVTGNMGDLDEKFPFAIIAKYTDDTTDTSTTTLVDVKYTIADKNTSGATIVNATPSILAASATFTSEAAFKLKNNESVEITVPNNVTVMVKELTDSAEGYEITSTATSFEGTATTISTAVHSDTTGTGGLAKGSDPTVEYTNNRESISPTGVVLRFAPYFAMFAAGCVLFLILATKRSKKEEE